MQRNSLGFGMAGSGGSLFPRNSRTSAIPGSMGSGSSNQINCILVLLTLLAVKIVGEGSGSLEYMGGELQLERISIIIQRDKKIKRFGSIIYFMLNSILKLIVSPYFDKF